MENLFRKLRVDINENIFVKDPLSSELGKNIIHQGIHLIAVLGIENFTFKKLAIDIGCTESAIYRYFENKHKLMMYLTLWYWGFLEQNIIVTTANLTDPNQRLHIAIGILVKGPLFPKNDFIDPLSLKKLLVDEGTKAFMTKKIDHEYRFGYFMQFDRLITRVAGMVSEINPDYPFPKALISTIMESGLVQTYYSTHLPNLTELVTEENEKVDFFTQMVFKTIGNE
jgi:AcrR family transcriptional regulator